MRLATALLQLFQDNRQPALFVGAGISANAGIPVGLGIVNLLKQQYPEVLTRPADEYSYSEAFIAALPGKQHRSARRQLFEDLCAGIAPGKEHHLIAHLVQHQIFSIVFTTNFDQLIEIALRTRCTPQPQVYLYDEDIEPFGYSSDIAKLIKLHGDFLFDDMANLQEELRERLHENMRAKLHTYLEDRGLVVVGCGGQDTEVMKFLSEVARSENGLKDGLWWLVYDENYHGAMLDGVISDARHAGKYAEIIGPGHALDFLESICLSLRIDSPEPAPFGIGANEQTLLSSYTHRFGRARQLPPADLPVEVDACLQRFMNELELAAKAPGVVWLYGAAGSGKTTLVGKLATTFDPKCVFYFDHRFAHRPVHLSLVFDMERFADGLGVPVRNPLQALEDLFRKNVVLIFDDLFSSNPMPEVEFINELRNIIALRETVGQGTIVLVTASENAELLNWVIKIIQIAAGERRPGNFTGIKLPDPAARSADTAPTSLLADKFGGALQVMSLLRFAELPEIIGKLCEQPMHEALEVFERNQLVDRRGQRYVLRNHVQIAVEDSLTDIPALRLTLAKRFEALIPEQPYFRRAHYAIEAEAQYWQAKEFKQALRQFLTVAETLAAAGEWRFVYSTLRDYIWDADSSALLSQLPAELVIPLLDLAYEAARYGILRPEDLRFLQESVLEVVIKRGEGYTTLLQAIRARRAGDFDGTVAALLQAADEFRAAGNVEYLASVLFDLSASKFEQILYSIDEEGTRAAREWAQEAEALYSELGDVKRVAKTRDHLATALIHAGDYEAARELEDRQRKVHAEAEGFTDEKGVVYGNLFVTNLALGRLAQAEGYFHQSNLNYSWVRNRRGILINVLTLYRWAKQSPQNVDRVFPGEAVWQERKDHFVEVLGACVQSLQQEMMSTRS